MAESVYKEDGLGRVVMVSVYEDGERALEFAGPASRLDGLDALLRETRKFRGEQTHAPVRYEITVDDPLGGGIFG